MTGFLQTAKDWAPVIELGASGVAAWAAWSLRQIAKAEVSRIVNEAEARLREQIDPMDQKVDQHETQIAKIETRLEDMPSAGDLARLEGAMAKVESAAAAAAAGVARLEGYFLSKGVERS